MPNWGHAMTDGRTKRLNGTRVLIVEDEYYLADDLSRELTGAGAQVVGPVGTLAEAEAKVGEGHFDCAVVDMNLRGDFAYAVARRLGEAGVPFIITTGYNSGSLPKELQGIPRVEKPFVPGQVVDLIHGMKVRSA